MSDKLPGGYIKTYGLFVDSEQVGFQCWAEYTPHTNINAKRKLHSNRTVIHPDYCGFGLGMRLIDETAKLLAQDHDLYAKFSNLAVARAFEKSKIWILASVNHTTPSGGGNMTRYSGFRKKVKTFSYRYKGESNEPR